VGIGSVQGGGVEDGCKLEYCRNMLVEEPVWLVMDRFTWLFCVCIYVLYSWHVDVRDAT
jgi:hypothetical protein